MPKRVKAWYDREWLVPAVAIFTFVSAPFLEDIFKKVRRLNDEEEEVVNLLGRVTWHPSREVVAVDLGVEVQKGGDDETTTDRGNAGAGTPGDGSERTLEPTSQESDSAEPVKSK